MNIMANSLVKKYISNNLRVLAKIHKMNKLGEKTYFSDIESYLNREKNQVSNVLGKLEKEDLIKREKKMRPQRLIITESGKLLLKAILDELS